MAFTSRAQTLHPPGATQARSVAAATYSSLAKVFRGILATQRARGGSGSFGCSDEPEVKEARALWQAQKAQKGEAMTDWLKLPWSLISPAKRFFNIFFGGILSSYHCFFWSFTSIVATAMSCNLKKGGHSEKHKKDEKEKRWQTDWSCRDHWFCFRTQIVTVWDMLILSMFLLILQIEWWLQRWAASYRSVATTRSTKSIRMRSDDHWSLFRIQPVHR